ncbi:hypothetical protein MCOR13_009435 [Pyricularia oryzae]|nr:hypothetical protein MCOR13_009435 [Pyricularia oryzae]
MHDIACRISISRGSVRIVSGIFFDPSTDVITLKNDQPELEPGAWELVAPAVSSSNKLLVLPRRFLHKEAGATKVPSGERPLSSTVGHASKRVQDAGGVVHNLHVERIPRSCQSLHPLMGLLPNQTITIAGAGVQEYSITRVQKLSETRASSVWRALVSIFSPEQPAVVAKVLLKGRNSTPVIAEMWLREAKIHSKLNSQDSDSNVSTIVKLLGLDARLHSFFGLSSDAEQDSVRSGFPWRCMGTGRGNAFPIPAATASRVDY